MIAGELAVELAEMPVTARVVIFHVDSETAEGYRMDVLEVRYDPNTNTVIVY